ncbi:MAG: hypothetical protein Q4F33_00365 [Mycoplasmatota bacterium]|nr:hypothetical protein [Mycoplasmatota bacterium]
MLENITFKTELSEILTVEEVTMLFDNVSTKYTTTLVALSLFPLFNKLRTGIINKTAERRNQELSKLLSEISLRKRETKVNIWQVLGTMGQNKKRLQEKLGNKLDLEQLLYEEEQIINAYENSVKSLEIKEKKIMSGLYSRIDRVISTVDIHSLNKQISNLKQKIMELSEKHDDCFKEYEDDLTQLVANTIITDKSFPKKKFLISSDSNNKGNKNTKDDLEEVDDGQMHYTRTSISKEYYQYEPIDADDDDELFFQLFSQGSYGNKDGTINELLIATGETE